MKAIKTGTNNGGKKFALVTNGRTFWVMGRSVNYSLGRDVVSWHKIHPKRRATHREFQDFAKAGISYEEALAMFEKKLKGKAKH